MSNKNFDVQQPVAKSELSLEQETSLTHELPPLDEVRTLLWGRNKDRNHKEKAAFSHQQPKKGLRLE